jgi:hypothetical protein
MVIAFFTPYNSIFVDHTLKTINTFSIFDHSILLYCYKSP